MLKSEKNELDLEIMGQYDENQDKSEKDTMLKHTFTPPPLTNAKTGKLQLLIIFLAILYLAELGSAIRTRSLVLMADSFQIFSDLFLLMIKVYLIQGSHKFPNEKMTYGMNRITIVGNRKSNVFKEIGGNKQKQKNKQIKNKKAKKTQKQEHSAAKTSVSCSQQQICKQKGDEDKHSKICDQKKKSKRNQNTNKFSFHLTCLLFISAAVLTDGLIFFFMKKYKKTDAKWLLYIDTSISLFIALIIFLFQIPSIKKNLKIIMQATPDKIDIVSILDKIQKIDELVSFHNLRLWQYSGDLIVGTIHIVITKNIDYNQAVLKILKIFHNHKVNYITIQPEFIDSSSRSNFSKNSNLTGIDSSGGLNDMCIYNCCQNELQSVKFQQINGDYISNGDVLAEIK
ncbi:hypothetical protein M0813_07354 [Anaeramoeba flamelloides]|uniref:Uncharacterized protein n=1 Tax=Anaeramoeba flamelloides TaxID=1746091 RepID=A0ABQ8XAQ0_9EUKA|nr:hypothetical protein M0813_07354 [Anaeramoeba flamelloides]